MWQYLSTRESKPNYIISSPLEILFMYHVYFSCVHIEYLIPTEPSLFILVQGLQKKLS